jgi:hypothetical protein
MTVLLDQSFPRTLDVLLERAKSFAPGTLVEAWLFEGLEARAAAEAALQEMGLRTKLRSAYKPLVHAFLEETIPDGPITIVLPIHPATTAQRWRLEAYPLAGMRQGIAFAPGDAPLEYGIEPAGLRVFAPNRMVTDPQGQPSLAPCGWLRLTDAAGTVLENGPLETEFEQIFAAGMACLAAHPWPEKPPFFKVLRLTATLPAIAVRLPYGDEAISTVEALHEEFYFSILEHLKHRAGLAPSDRTLQPGQIVPDITEAEGPVTLRITLVDAPPDFVQPGPVDLEDADRPLTPGQIEAELEALGGTQIHVLSLQGRRVGGTVIAGPHAPIVISAGQHANETASVVGGFRAVQRLIDDEQGALAFIPMENPDGHALHHALRQHNPRHMLHAARYTALGDDLESRQSPPFHEKALRLHALATTRARLHISLHGYPSHEWTRPLTGYLPRGFELWTIPKGFFLIIRHRPGLAAQAHDFARALAAEIAADPALRAFNQRQLDVWQAHVGSIDFPVFDAVPCLISENPNQTIDFTLITEYPDETIYGDAFRLAHTSQMRAVLAAVRLFRALPHPG